MQLARLSTGAEMTRLMDVQLTVSSIAHRPTFEPGERNLFVSRPPAHTSPVVGEGPLSPSYFFFFSSALPLPCLHPRNAISISRLKRKDRFVSPDGQKDFSRSPVCVEEEGCQRGASQGPFCLQYSTTGQKPLCLPPPFR